ncbi:MAG: glycosyltransferase family 4 protein [Verrucomicrobiae bacterium]|nr:glycosyltransferase family 4 protein [Verrucomicrobiae bacterium]
MASSSPLTVAYVAGCAPGDVRHWSGTTHFMGQSLAQAGLNVRHLGPFHVPGHWWRHFKYHFYRRLLRQNYLALYDLGRAKALGRAVTAAVAQQPADVVLGSFGDHLAFLETNLPLVVWTDGTFIRMRNFYPDYQNLCAATLKAGEWIDRTVLQRCRLAVFATDWAAESALRHYGVDPHKVHVIPFGANLECHRTLADIEALIAARPESPCRLLFVGRLWERKGGDLAMAVAARLNALGLPTELTLVGSRPPHGQAVPAYVKVRGFIDKSTAAGRAELDRLFAESHFLLLPTRAEAYGIVFCEAASFGLPSLATAVGGVPSIIREGLNGHTFPASAGPDLYAYQIERLMRRYYEYRLLARNAFLEYQRRLNWPRAAQRMRALLEKITGRD